MTLESSFKRKLSDEIEDLFPGCVILRNDPSSLQGISDLLILYRRFWGILEVKRSKDAEVRPNQKYWVDLANDMGAFGAFIYPENKREVLNELQRSFRP